MKLTQKLLLAVLLPLAAVGNAAETYPSKAVEIIVSWPPGGGSDAVGRAIADAMKGNSDKTYLVINRPGASGTIGNTYAATAGKDGYKVLLMTPEMLMAPLIGVGKSSIEEIRPIARLTDDAIAITVRADAPWNTIEEFLAFAKASAGKTTVSVPGLGTTGHVSAVAINRAAGVELVSVPYQGTAPAVMGVLSGDVHATATPYAELSKHVEAKKLKVLGVMSAQRLKSQPGVPTFAERGYPLLYSIWRGIGISKDAPPEAVAFWRAEAPKIIAAGGFNKTLEALNMSASYLDDAQFSEMVNKQLASFKELAPSIKDR